MRHFCSGVCGGTGRKLSVTLDTDREEMVKFFLSYCVLRVIFNKIESGVERLNRESGICRSGPATVTGSHIAFRSLERGKPLWEGAI